jgi:hypothetical protein
MLKFVSLLISTLALQGAYHIEERLINPINSPTFTLYSNLLQMATDSPLSLAQQTRVFMPSYGVA